MEKKFKFSHYVKKKYIKYLNKKRRRNIKKNIRVTFLFFIYININTIPRELGYVCEENKIK